MSSKSLFHIGGSERLLVLNAYPLNANFVIDFEAHITVRLTYSYCKRQLGINLLKEKYLFLQEQAQSPTQQLPCGVTETQTGRNAWVIFILLFKV